MNLGKIIAGIKQNIAIRQKGVHADHVMVDRRELQILMAHFDDMETELRVIHSRRAGLKDNSTATEYLMSSENNARRLSESAERINTGDLKCPCQNYPLCAWAGCIPLTPQQNGGFPTEHCNYVKHQSSQPDIYRMITEQNPEQRSQPRKEPDSMNYPGIPIVRDANNCPHCSEPYLGNGKEPCMKCESDKVTIMASDAYGQERHRKPVTSFDWELQQALIHLQNAISVTDSRRGHLLQAAVSITKGVRESD